MPGMPSMPSVPFSQRSHSSPYSSLFCAISRRREAPRKNRKRERARRGKTLTAQTLAHLPPMQTSPPITLKGRALDSRTKHPALGDPLADEMIRAIDTAAGVYWYDVDFDE